MIVHGSICMCTDRFGVCLFVPFSEYEQQRYPKVSSVLGSGATAAT